MRLPSLSFPPLDLPVSISLSPSLSLRGLVSVLYIVIASAGKEGSVVGRAEEIVSAGGEPGVR